MWPLISNSFIHSYLAVISLCDCDCRHDRDFAFQEAPFRLGVVSIIGIGDGSYDISSHDITSHDISSHDPANPSPVRRRFLVSSHALSAFFFP
jgi:hypothetical protein